MPFKPIPIDKVPGYAVIQARLHSIDANVAAAEAFYEFDKRQYRLTLTGPNGRHAEVVFSGDFLDDVQDNPDGPRTGYSIDLTTRLQPRCSKL